MSPKILEDSHSVRTLTPPDSYSTRSRKKWTRPITSNWVKMLPQLKEAGGRMDPLSTSSPPICKMFRVQEKGEGGEIWGTRDVLCNHHLWRNERLSILCKTRRFPHCTKIERHLRKRKKKKRNTDIISPSVFSSGWKPYSPFSFLSSSFIHSRNLLSSLFLLLLRGKLPIKEQRKKDYFFAHGFFSLFTCGDSRQVK